MDVKLGYKQTQVGVIPEDWLEHSVGDLFDFEGGSQPDKSVFSPSLKPSFVRLIQIRDYKTDKFKTYVPRNLARRFCTENDIMIGRYGPPIFQILRGLAGAYNVALIKAQPHPEISLDYAYYVLIQEKLFAFVEKLSQRSSGQTGIDLKELKAYPLPLPPTKAEQEAIAGALSDADALIESLEHLLTKKRQIKQGAMQELLTGKKRLPGFSGEWETKKIAEVATACTEKNSLVEDRPVLTCSKHLGFVDSLSYFKNQVFSKDLSGYKIIRRGQIGYPANHIEEGSIGLQDFYDIALVSPIYVVCSPKEGTNSYFLHRLLKLDKYRQEFAIATTSSVDRRGSLRWSAFSEIVVNLPHTEEQCAIAAVLSDMDTEIAGLESKLSKAREIKQGMMQELLTGRIRLV